MIQILHELRTLKYGNYGIFLIVGTAGLISSTVLWLWLSSTLLLLAIGLGLGLRVRRQSRPFILGNLQVGSYRYRSLIEGLYTL